MIFMYRVYAKLHPFIPRVNPRCCFSQTIAENDIKKSVLISQSRDIFTNLALEDWIYRNMNFKDSHILMLWQNEPCVVIGRHQNPWLEANVSDLPNIADRGVQLARRNSGGGTVFHDLGNLNLTFFTLREHYNRRNNLEILSRSIFRNFGMKMDISPREDVTLHGCKVSGTAAKLGRPNAYHHCTLLVNSNKAHLSRALHKGDVDVETNATRSTKSKIKNLCEENPDISITKLIKAIEWEYMRTSAFSLIDGGMELANKQKEIKTVDPTDAWFPGLSEIRAQYASWEWCYGKTPKFTISKSFTVPENLHLGKKCDLNVKVTVESGRISDITFAGAPDLLTPMSATSDIGVNGDANLIGQKFSQEALMSLDTLLGGLIDDKNKFVTNCLKQIITCV